MKGYLFDVSKIDHEGNIMIAKQLPDRRLQIAVLNPQEQRETALKIIEQDETLQAIVRHFND